MILVLCANGIADSVRERLPEFGVLKAMGFRDSHVARLVILEAAIPTLLAALIGGALAWAIDAVVAHLSLTGAIAFPETRATVSAFGWAIAAALVIALLSAVAPLHRLRRLDATAVITGR